MAVGDLADDPGGGAVDLGDQMLCAIIGLADPVGVEAVGAKKIGTGAGITFANLSDELGPGQAQQVVVALLC